MCFIFVDSHGCILGITACTFEMCRLDTSTFASNIGQHNFETCPLILKVVKCKMQINLFQVLNHLHKKLRNMSKKSEASKKKVDCFPYQAC